MHSSSFHKINADKKLSKPLQVVWFAANYLNNLGGNFFVDKNLTVKKFVPGKETDWAAFNLKSSPARLLSDIFWMDFPWEQLRNELGEIRLLDIGCGKGGYYEKFRKFSNGALSSYFGIDVQTSASWEELQKNNSQVRFAQLNGVDIEKFLVNRNVLVSQSAIEHIENDLDYFRQISNYLRDTRSRVVQVHLFPTKANLRTYLLHGVRQYTRRTVSLISKLFSEYSECTLYELGGERCNKLHFRSITWPLIMKRTDLRDSNFESYTGALKEAIGHDFSVPAASPTFFALVIKSNFNH